MKFYTHDGREIEEDIPDEGYTQLVEYTKEKAEKIFAELDDLFENGLRFSGLS